ncbi:MAG: efflux RND transporter periplasmic adaptor subunit, partial [Vicinamibacteria bacterium]|nr:efflux RND transporter periplasmic adaptor subunit [Vicinamibacteria bacterium]
AEPDERQLALLKIGQVSAASADAYPHERFAARMTYVSPLVDAQRGTIEVRLDVERPPAYLRPDMTVSIEVEVARRSEAVLLPIDAIRASGSAEPWVLVVRDGRIARQAIVIGAQDETRAEVRQGLREGELVVVAPLVALAPGQRVRPRVTAKN